MPFQPVSDNEILFFRRIRRIMPKVASENDLMNPKTLQNLLNSTFAYWIGLGIAIVILGVAVHYLRAWFRDGDDPADKKDEILGDMEELRRQGVLSETEFRSIKSQLSEEQKD